MKPIAGLLLGVLLIAIFALPRKWALLSMVTGTLYLAMGGGLEIAGLNFFPARVLGYTCFLRVIFRNEFSIRQLGKTDYALLILYGFTTVVLITREDEGLLLRIAKFFDVSFTYLAFRALFKSFEDFTWLISVTTLLLVPYVFFLFLESRFGYTFFEILGAHGKVWLREGTPRCFGSFGHPSLLGSLGACMLPVYIGLAWDPSLRKRAILGIMLCLAIVGFSNSGGPMSVVTIAIAGWLAWPARTRMRLFRRGLVAALVLLGLVMKAPIWYLLAKVSSVTGGTGWHRSYLMDVAFRNLEKWWLIGMPVEETAGWLPYTLGATGGADITNQFISFGLSGGLLAIAMFIFILYCAFSVLGQAQNSIRRNDDARKQEAILWGLGVALAAHISNWLGITYYDQFYVVWLLQLASIVSLSTLLLRKNPEQARSVEIQVEKPPFTPMGVPA